jgi:uncharacterized protein (DUF2235 family)
MRPGGKRIALFLDGRWNTVSNNTNICRMRALCGKNSIDGARQAIYYDQSVGTRFGERVRGGIFGYGLDRNVQAAYRWLIKTRRATTSSYLDSVAAPSLRDRLPA